jgi:PAS domain S-box-containing protein
MNEAAKSELASARKRDWREELSLVADAIPQQVWSGPSDGSFDYCNDRLQAFVGLTPEQLSGNGWQQLLHPEDRERVVLAWRYAVANGKPYEQELRYRGADGTYRWFLARGCPLRDEDGRVIRWCVTNTDIEEHRQAEAALRKQKELLEKIFEHIPLMIALVGKTGKIELVNAEWEHVLGWTLKELTEQKVDIFEHALPNSNYRQIVRDFVAAATGEWMDMKVAARDGRIIDLAVTAIHLSDGTSLSIGREITAGKLTENALREAQANLSRIARIMSMGEIAATIAHEVNQPLAAIVTNANFCLRRLDMATSTELRPVREAIAEVIADGTRASEVISRIRSVFQKNPTPQVEFDINEIIPEVAVLLRDELHRHNITLRMELGVGMPSIIGDRVQLLQTFINLGMNAIEAMRPPYNRARELVIKSIFEHGEICIEVKDSGKGLDPEVAQQIFDPFFTTKPEGIGLGLSISRSIVESHGGRLWASGNVPAGTVFHFSLPAARRAA